MRILCTIEWLGPNAGWQAVADYLGKSITITPQDSFAAARRRLKAALVAAGASEPDLQITARMPRAIESDLARYKKLVELIPQLTSELDELKIKLAQRLTRELHFSERETAIWLGVSGAHISSKLRALAVDTGEFPRGTRDHEEDEDPGVATPAPKTQ